mgnify:CR=1 FL=1
MNSRFYLTLTLVIFFLGSTVVAFSFYFYLDNLNKKLKEFDQLLILFDENKKLRKEIPLLNDSLNDRLINIDLLKETILKKDNYLSQIEIEKDYLTSQLLNLKEKNRNLQQDLDNLEVRNISDESLSLDRKVKKLEEKLSSNSNEKLKLKENIITLKNKINDLEDLNKRNNQSSNLKTVDRLNFESEIKKFSQEIISLEKKLEKIKKDNKKIIKNYELTIKDLNKDLIFLKDYKNDLERLNGLKVVFSGYMRYDQFSNQIVFKNNDFVDIKVIQDDFSGKLVGECGLPINKDTEKRCSVTILAEIIFNEKGFFLKGKEIVDVLRQ